MNWSESYIGMPYVAIDNDCAALAVRVQREVFNREIALPTDRAFGNRGLSKQIDTLRDDYGIETDAPVEGDAVLMRCRGRLTHIGVYCEIGGVPYVLHAMKNAGQVVLHKIRELESKGLQLGGFYRWK